MDTLGMRDGGVKLPKQCRGMQLCIYTSLSYLKWLSLVILISLLTYSTQLTPAHSLCLLSPNTKFFLRLAYFSLISPPHPSYFFFWSLPKTLSRHPSRSIISPHVLLTMARSLILYHSIPLSFPRHLLILTPTPIPLLHFPPCFPQQQQPIQVKGSALNSSRRSI